MFHGPITKPIGLYQLNCQDRFEGFLGWLLKDLSSWMCNDS